jgi:hypothetical protein
MHRKLVPDSWIERFEKSMRSMDRQFVNSDADAQQKPRKRARHAPPAAAQG